VALFIGLMSGTSLDGIDGVLAEIDADDARVLSHRHRPFEPGLRSELLALNSAGGADELQRAALAANGVALAYAQVVAGLLAASGRTANDLRAIGAHGQTVRHRPGAVDGVGYTLQILNPALLAERVGIDVVADFRSRDVAAGGQGAPLVPAFHARCFRVPGQDVAVLNLGGIANLTLLPAAGAVRGFDCGPANALMDDWIARHLGAPFDDGGRWAAGGRVDEALLATLLTEPFFALPPPKSTGRDLFNPAWLAARLPAGLDPRDVMATLAELTARAAVQALQRLAPTTARLVVCGGGAFNAHLMARLAALLPKAAVTSSAGAGAPPDQVEALAFAWLAWAFGERVAGNLVEVTGAAGPRVLGALYPA
jgi:anhydro-N-acetylmuramic acid kinase